MKRNYFLIAILIILTSPILLFANNASDISVDFDIFQRSGTYEVTVKIKNISDKDLSLRHPDLQYSVAIIVMNEKGNLLQPAGIAKVSPRQQFINLKPKQVFEYATPIELLDLAREKNLNLPFLTGTALFGYPLEKGKTYRIIVIYRPYGKDKGGICSKEKIIKFKNI